MSSTILYEITPSGQIGEAAEFRNAWLGAMLCWSQLYQRYCQEQANATEAAWGFRPAGPTSKADAQAVWALFQNPAVPMHTRAVLGATFDRVYLETQHAERFWNDVMQYAGEHQAGTLIEQANFIMAARDKAIMGWCWNQTSVTDGLWSEGDIHAVDGAWSLYQELDNLRKQEQDGER